MSTPINITPPKKTAIRSQSETALKGAIARVHHVVSEAQRKKQRIILCWRAIGGAVIFAILIALRIS